MEFLSWVWWISCIFCSISMGLVFFFMNEGMFEGIYGYFWIEFSKGTEGCCDSETAS